MSTERIFKVDEDKCHIALWWATSANPKASADQGRPVFDKVLKGRIIAPMQARSEFECVLLREFHDGTVKHQEPYWSKYKAQAQQFMSSDEGGDLQGTPIDQWTMIDAPMAATLKALHIYTVEILAQQEGTGIQRIGMGAQSLVSKARNWLAAAKDSAVISRLTESEARHAAENADLKRQLAELAARVQDQEDRKVDGRTREGRALRARDEAA